MFHSKPNHFHSRKCIWMCYLQNPSHLSRPQCIKHPCSPGNVSHGDVIKWKHFRVTDHLCGEFTGHQFHVQRPVTRSFGVFFDLRPNKRLSKQSWGWWFETSLRPFWRHRNAKVGITDCQLDWLWQNRSRKKSKLLWYDIAVMHIIYFAWHCFSKSILWFDYFFIAYHMSRILF